MHTRNSESHMQIAESCAPCKVVNRTVNLVLQDRKFHKVIVCRKFSDGVDKVIADLMSVS
jgi:hypothetical protein